MEYNPQLLIISGTGRNTGKTTLACDIISYFSNQIEITGVKISPHFHKHGKHIESLFESELFNLYWEITENSEKDTSRMLKTGAAKVFYADYFYDSSINNPAKIIDKLNCSSEGWKYKK